MLVLWGRKDIRFINCMANALYNANAVMKSTYILDLSVCAILEC